MDQEEARREILTLSTDSITAISRHYGPSNTATLLRALADMIEESYEARMKRLN